MEMEMEIEKIPKNKLLLLNKKYVFHGSPNFFDICKPNKANCDTKNPASECFAIHGCEYVEPAILFAFTKKSINRNKEAYWKVDFDKTSFL